MFTETPTRTARRRSLRLAIGIAVAGSVIVIGSGPVAAASGTQIVTGATSGGMLSITAPGGAELADPRGRQLDRRNESPVA